MSKSSKMRRPISGGSRCPKCHHRMQRYEHTSAWQSKPDRGFYVFWDVCRQCYPRHIQLYREAYRDPTGAKLSYVTMPRDEIIDETEAELPF